MWVHDSTKLQGTFSGSYQKSRKKTSCQAHKTKILLSAGKLPSGSQLSITTHVFRASKPGPTVLLLGGIHGDEINGIEIITSLLESQYLQQLKSGCVFAIPLLNVFGFNNMSRDMPDGKDVNRSFPGNKSGSLASRVARVLPKHFTLADYAIDLHTGGAHRYNYPHTDILREMILHKSWQKFCSSFAVKQALIAHICFARWPMTCIPMYWSTKQGIGTYRWLAVKRASRASSMCLLILKCYRPNKIYSQHSQPYISIKPPGFVLPIQACFLLW